MEVLDALPPDSARTDEGVNSRYPEVWGIEVAPTNRGAAPVYVTYGGGDEVIFGFGETHVYLFDDDPDAVASEVRELFTAVVSGAFVEAGRQGDSFARVQTPRGEVHVGAVALPLPWRWRRVRTYQPYGPTA